MKKILAFMLSMIMIFSVVAAPVNAAAPDISQDQISGAIGDVSDEASDAIDAATGVIDSFETGDFGAAIGGIFDFAIELFEAIHALVHALYPAGNQNITLQKIGIVDVALLAELFDQFLGFFLSQIPAGLYGIYKQL